MNESRADRDMPIVSVEQFLEMFDDEELMAKMGIEFIPLEREVIAVREENIYEPKTQAKYNTTMLLNGSETTSEALAA